MKRPLSQVNLTVMTSFFDNHKQSKTSSNLGALMHALGNLNKPQRHQFASQLHSSFRSANVTNMEEDGTAHLSTFDMERWQGEPKKRQAVSGGVGVGGGGGGTRARGGRQVQPHHAQQPRNVRQVQEQCSRQQQQGRHPAREQRVSSSTVTTVESTSTRSGSESSVGAYASAPPSSNQENQSNEAEAWRTATCPNTGKTYYWNIYTRESRWKKPIELATPAERNAIQSKEKAQRDFFSEMEANILKKWKANSVNTSGNAAVAPEGENATISSINAGIGLNNTIVSCSTSVTSSDASIGSAGSGGSGSNSPGSLTYREERDDKVPPLVKKSKLERLKSGSKPIIDKPKLIRTISKMEYDLATQLRNTSSAVFNGARGALGNSKEKISGANQRTKNAGAVVGVDMNEHLAGAYGCLGLPFAEILSSLNLTQEPDGIGCILNADEFLNVPSPNSPLTTSSTDLTMSESLSLSPMSTQSASASPRNDLAKPCLAKRNTCGTIYLGSTLSAPDKDALIKCVCGVFRAHLLQSRDSHVYTTSPRYASSGKVFNDDLKAISRYNRDAFSIPTLEDITAFYRDIFLRSQMEVDCIIISLIYVERLIKKTDGRVRPNVQNWRSVLFSCMVLSSKVWDDLSMWNCDFSKIGPSGVTFSLQRTNELEVALLSHLEYSVKVNASEYAKYYFLLRSMLCRSGLASDNITALDPLDAKGAKGLEKTGVCVDTALPKPCMRTRSKSLSDAEPKDKGEGFKKAMGGLSPQSPPTKKVSLEQIVRM